MNLTQEQQTIINYITEQYEKTTFTALVNSVAGSGKTTLLTAISRVIPHTNGLYLSYNKSIAVEASHKFPSTTTCSTTHSLAYQAVVKQFGLKVGNFFYKSITEKISYEHKLQLIDLIREFCLSSYTDVDLFCKDYKLNDFTTSLVVKYLTQMGEGKIECTHDFYLKYFHIVLHDNLINYPKFDFVMIDEFGDVNEVTLEIFKLLPAKFKVATGDRHQNVYTFNHTINGFEALLDYPNVRYFDMTKSFRVASHIAEDIQSYCREFLDPDMKFKGIELTDARIVTRGYITRTNSALIGKMIELMESGTPFSLVRKASDIFKNALMVCSFKYQGNITDPTYSHVQSDIDDWYENVKHVPNAPTLSGYLMGLHSHDFTLLQAIKLVVRYSTKKVFEVYEYAKSMEGKKTNLTLFSSHSGKGLEFDEVTIGNDMNELISKLLEVHPTRDTMTEHDIAELNLGYVAASRARVQLNNAQFLQYRFKDG